MVHLKGSLLARGARTGRTHALKNALHHALQLEHATIPLYLYSMYSLNKELNHAARSILKSAVIEEMLHMVLVGNLLNALGAEPRVTGTGFVPRYPCHLPGGVEGQLVLHLAPLSPEQIRAFMEIEEPREALVSAADDDLEVGSCTIGEFYLAIERSIARLSDSDFCGDPARQVGPDLMWGSVAVTNRESAEVAIGTIIEQGEGSKSSPAECAGTDDADLAHYYRFMQLHEGRRLVHDESERGFGFVGEDLSIDPAGLYPLPLDPRASDHAVGSLERSALDNFNTLYLELLRQIDHLLNGGANTETFGKALRTMKDLDRQAVLLVARGLGPTFEVS